MLAVGTSVGGTPAEQPPLGIDPSADKQCSTTPRSAPLYPMYVDRALPPVYPFRTAAATMAFMRLFLATYFNI